MEFEVKAWRRRKVTDDAQSDRVRVGLLES